MERIWLTVHKIAFSMNYMVGEDEMTIEDPANALKIYDDKNTSSGNVIKVAYALVFLMSVLQTRVALTSLSMKSDISVPTAGGKVALA